MIVQSGCTTGTIGIAKCEKSGSKRFYNAHCRTGLSFIKPGSQLIIALGLFIIDS